jgi:hypothetical protein
MHSSAHGVALAFRIRVVRCRGSWRQQQRHGTHSLAVHRREDVTVKVSRVIPTVACARIADTTFGWTPPVRSKVAVEWRRSWSRSEGHPPVPTGDRRTGGSCSEPPRVVRARWRRPGRGHPKPGRAAAAPEGDDPGQRGAQPPHQAVRWISRRERAAFGSTGRVPLGAVQRRADPEHAHRKVDVRPTQAEQFATPHAGRQLSAPGCRTPPAARPRMRPRALSHGQGQRPDLVPGRPRRRSPPPPDCAIMPQRTASARARRSARAGAAPSSPSSPTSTSHDLPSRAPSPSSRRRASFSLHEAEAYVPWDIAENTPIASSDYEPEDSCY